MVMKQKGNRKEKKMQADVSSCLAQTGNILIRGALAETLVSQA